MSSGLSVSVIPQDPSVPLALANVFRLGSSVLVISILPHLSTDFKLGIDNILNSGLPVIEMLSLPCVPIDSVDGKVSDSRERLWLIWIPCKYLLDNLGNAALIN